MTIPFISLQRTESDFMDRWIAISNDISRNYAFIGGAHVEALEKNLTQWTQTNHAISCANGTDAIQLALRGAGVAKNDAVLVPDATFWATFEAVVNVGANPYTVAVDLKDGCVDFDVFAQAIEEVKPKAAIVVHLYGWGPARLADIRQLCRAKGVLLIEDGAQSFGTTYKGQSIYKDAMVSTTSFYPAKVLGAAGDGGAVFTNDAELASTVRKLSNHGRTSHYGHGLVGWNSRMDSLQAAYVNLSLEYFEQRLDSRRQTAAWYRKNLSNPNLLNVEPHADYAENGYCNVNLVTSNAIRTALEIQLKAQGIGFGNIYPMAVSDQPGATGFLEKHIGEKSATDMSLRVLNLPLFPYMKAEELQEIAELVNATSDSPQNAA
jgi:UDP-2-acetamido-2-deoxy-ribo-hexuluronate aminotransferase